MTEAASQVTLLLAQVQGGDQAARNRLFQFVEEELRGIAQGYMRQERPDHTLQATILADEAFLRLANCANVNWQDRSHFYCAAARAMRRILVDHERQRRAQRRGRDKQQRLREQDDPGHQHFREDLLALHDALGKLEELDSRQSDIVDLFHFGGFTIEEIAKLMNLSRSTVKRELAAARAWLHRELSDDEVDS